MVGSILKELQEPIVEEDLFSVLHMKEDDRSRWQGSMKIPTPDELALFCERYGVDPEYIYWVPKGMPTFCYYKFPTIILMDMLDDKYWEFAQIEERVKRTTAINERAMEEKDYFRIFAFTDNRAKIMLLNKLYWMVPDDMKYNIWNEIYTLIDYGYTAIDKKIYKDVWNHQPIQQKENVQKRLSLYEPGDVLTIYRGEGGGSTPYSEAMSWTLSITVAGFFATRIRSDLKGKIYRAKVRKEHVLDFDNGRNEEEVVVFPEHVVDVEEIPMVSFVEEWNSMNEMGYLDEYYLYKNTFIKEDDYKHPEGIHGVDHVKRVLFHAISLAKSMNLSSSDRAILANASVYHDIGRVHDGYCTKHGDWSWKQLRSQQTKLMEVNCVEPLKRGDEAGQYDLRLLDKTEQVIVQFLIEYHCRDDKSGERALQKLPLSEYEKERAWMLYQVFKDSDGLDRVRLGLNELDPNYLRTKDAKGRLTFAFQTKNFTHKL